MSDDTLAACAAAADEDSEAARVLWRRMEEIPPHPYLDAASPMRS